MKKMGGGENRKIAKKTRGSAGDSKGPFNNPQWEVGGFQGTRFFAVFVGWDTGFFALFIRGLLYF